MDGEVCREGGLERPTQDPAARGVADENRANRRMRGEKEQNPRDETVGLHHFAMQYARPAKR